MLRVRCHKFNKQQRFTINMAHQQPPIIPASQSPSPFTPAMQPMPTATPLPTGPPVFTGPPSPKAQPLVNQPLKVDMTSPLVNKPVSIGSATIIPPIRAIDSVSPSSTTTPEPTKDSKAGIPQEVLDAEKKEKKAKKKAKKAEEEAKSQPPTKPTFTDRAKTLGMWVAGILLLVLLLFATGSFFGPTRWSSDQKSSHTSTEVQTLRKEDEELKKKEVDSSVANSDKMDAIAAEKAREAKSADPKAEAGEEEDRPGAAKVVYEIYDPKKHKAKPDKFKAVQPYHASEEPVFKVSDKEEKVRTRVGIVKVRAVLTSQGPPLKDSGFVPVLADKSLKPYSLPVWWESQGEYIEHWFAK